MFCIKRVPLRSVFQASTLQLNCTTGSRNEIDCTMEKDTGNMDYSSHVNSSVAVGVSGIESALTTLQPIRDLAKNWDIDIAAW